MSNFAKPVGLKSLVLAFTEALEYLPNMALAVGGKCYIFDGVY